MDVCMLLSSLLMGGYETLLGHWQIAAIWWLSSALWAFIVYKDLT